MLQNASLVLLANLLRSLSQDSFLFLVLCHLASIINGLATILVMSAPPLVAALWFPEEERILATSISQVGIKRLLEMIIFM